MQIKYLKVQVLLLLKNIHSVCKKRADLEENYYLIFSVLASMSLFMAQ